MNAHLPACFFFVFLASSAVAQNVATISGQTLDQATSQPVPYASVVLKKRGDSTMTAGVLSDETGRFTLAGVAQGEYVLAVSFVGYAPSEVPLLIGSLNRNFDVGKIQLMPQNTMLDEVTVRAQREIVSAALDKKSFNLDENISQSGSSVLDAMRNLPGIGVSPDGKILLRGSENVSVLIDGKPSSLTGFSNQRGLENLPASNIERIEIINNPSAKYQSAGMAGVVNIIYKKGTNTGLHGEAGLAIGVGELYQRRANLPNISPKYSQTPKLNPTLSLNYRASKLNWFLQADGIIRRRINANEFFTRNYGDTRTDVSSQFLENRTQKLYNVKGGIDWFITPRNTLTLFALWQDEYHTDRGDVPFDNARTGERLRLWTWAEDERTKFINYSANFNHKFAQPGHELSFSYL
ncbi:MAG: TonB-dependent receptor, partial [Cytophagaceae bacterium]|nr:TonB-dependent receptor [Cytophagaceae bacterium]